MSLGEARSLPAPQGDVNSPIVSVTHFVINLARFTICGKKRLIKLDIVICSCLLVCLHIHSFPVLVLQLVVHSFLLSVKTTFITTSQDSVCSQVNNSTQQRRKTKGSSSRSMKVDMEARF